MNRRPLRRPQYHQPNNRPGNYWKYYPYPWCWEYDYDYDWEYDYDDDSLYDYYYHFNRYDSGKGAFDRGFKAGIKYALRESHESKPTESHVSGYCGSTGV